eukprot:SAG22_NODE_1810_length_3525_cov_13.151781_1_plen_108_part_10
MVGLRGRFAPGRARGMCRAQRHLHRGHYCRQPVPPDALTSGVYEGPADASELNVASRAVGGGGGATQMVPTTRLESKPRAAHLGGELRPQRPAATAAATAAAAAAAAS